MNVGDKTKSHWLWDPIIDTLSATLMTVIGSWRELSDTKVKELMTDFNYRYLRGGKSGRKRSEEKSHYGPNPIQMQIINKWWEREVKKLVDSSLKSYGY